MLGIGGAIYALYIYPETVSPKDKNEIARAQTGPGKSPLVINGHEAVFTPCLRIHFVERPNPGEHGTPMFDKLTVDTIEWSIFSPEFEKQMNQDRDYKEAAGIVIP